MKNRQAKTLRILFGAWLLVCLLTVSGLAQETSKPETNKTAIENLQLENSFLKQTIALQSEILELRKEGNEKDLQIKLQSIEITRLRKKKTGFNDPLIRVITGIISALAVRGILN